MKFKAIKITQPFDSFFVMKMTAFELISVSFSDPLRYNKDKELVGNQRDLRESRISEIGEYIEGVDAAFPNSIIISANYELDGSICESTNERWSYENLGNDIYEITIPTKKKLASIIDGQHRVNGFKKVSTERQKEIDLLVSVYFDLPNPYQAFIFATINYNQKSVDKSLALEQWGFSLETTDSKTWSPEMLAVFLTKKLNTDTNSPFYNHIIVAPQNDDYLFDIRARDNDWAISTATMVNGISGLITRNATRDLNRLRKSSLKKRTRELLEDVQFKNTPLRKFYIEQNDLLIYKIIVNYFKAADNLLFSKTLGTSSYIKKTVGIQALFDVLREILIKEIDKKKISVSFFESYLEKVSRVDFNNDYYQASGTGKTRIRNTIQYAIGYKTDDEFKGEDLEKIKRLLD